MLRTPPHRSALRRRAGHFGDMVRHSVVTPRTGQTHLPKLVSPGELGITFIGHSSFFIQIGGQNVVIDPNFARWLFVLKRLRQPGVRLRDLPPIDLVLVTHAHFDHLHRPSLRALVQQARRRGAKAPAIVVPHHVRDLVADLGFREVIELNWWHTDHQDNLVITHVHAGDTAYFSGFREIGERLKPEVALLPIGAYSPASFRNVHTSPADATRAFLDLKARWMIPMHYGTFRLSREPMEEPLQFLRAEARAAGIEDRLLVLEEGVTRSFSG